MRVVLCMCRWLRAELLEHSERIVLRVSGSCFAKHVEVDPEVFHHDLVRFAHPDQVIVLQLINGGLKGDRPYQWRNWYRYWM